MRRDLAYRAARPGGRRGEAFARRLAVALTAATTLLLAGAAAACDDFAAAPSSRWSIGAGETGPVLLTPCGEPFFSLGVNAIDGGAGTEFAAQPKRAYRWGRFAGTRAEWAAAARRRLVAWGFNTAGAWSVPPGEIGLPSTPELELGRNTQFVWIDPFDPAAASALERAAAAAVAPYRGNPLRIGYFSDNEIGWWNGPLFVAFLTYPPENHTKQRLVAMLREHYRDDWRAFARDFIPAPGTAGFDDLLAARAAPRLRPGGNGIAAVRAWTGLVAGRYYSVMREALRQADPEALYLGDRLPIYYDPDAVRAMASHVDAISVNYNVDTPDGWIASYFFDGLRDLSGGKPVLVTEWFYAAAENRSGNLNRTGAPNDARFARVSNNRNRTGHLMTVSTQEERALGAGRAAQLLAAAPGVIGVHWFQYADEPPGGRADGEDYNFGLVDVDDRPYEKLTRALRASNRLARSGMARAIAPEPGEDRDLVLPRAALPPTTQTLADWPKAASLVPMTAPPGETPFGDVHLAWNEDGLLLATIAMDYYAPELLGPIAPFPRSEAFRIALGVDAGDGPHRFELRVSPRDTAKSPEGETKLSFDAQVCRYAEDDTCAAVPGATVRYFGTALDQPRVILKAFIPWHGLGVSGPPRRAGLRLEVAATAFYRSRWMSLGGLAPQAAMADPARWLPVRLGGAARDWPTQEARENRAAARSN
ncbi:MAG: hypothetical protein AB7H71_00995 [Alphaproteobacteria bacterium]